MAKDAVSASAKSLEKRTPIRTYLQNMRNSSIMNDPDQDAPLAAVPTTWFCEVCYCAARGYIVTAEIIELRSLPPSAYKALIELHFGGILEHKRSAFSELQNENDLWHSSLRSPVSTG